MKKIPQTKRRLGKKILKETIYVLMEGKKTEPTLLKLVLEGLPNNRPFSISQKSGITSGKELSKKAIELVKDNDTCEVWIVCDVDNSADSLKEYVESTASKSNIYWAISNPSIEVWMVLHIQLIGKYQTVKDLENTAKKIRVVSPEDPKTPEISKLRGQLDCALQNTNLLRETHSKNHVYFPDDNPSTNFDLLIQALVDKINKTNPSVPIRIEDIY